MYIAIDFDGTIVEHEYPDIGEAVPGAFECLRKFQEAGAKLILWTMRGNGKDGPRLNEAVAFCKEQGVEFYGVNFNPTQGDWTDSRKAYAQIYIDDAAFGCPVRENPRFRGRPFVDWEIVGPAVLGMILKSKQGRDARPRGGVCDGAEGAGGVDRRDGVTTWQTP